MRVKSIVANPDIIEFHSNNKRRAPKMIKPEEARRCLTSEGKPHGQGRGFVLFFNFLLIISYQSSSDSTLTLLLLCLKSLIFLLALGRNVRRRLPFHP